MVRSGDGARDNVEFEASQERNVVVQRGRPRDAAASAALQQQRQREQERENSDIIRLLAGVSIIAFFVAWVLGVAMRFLLGIVGIIVPAWKTFRAMDSSDSRVETKWLMYWVLCGLCLTCDALFIKACPLPSLVVHAETLTLFLLAQNDARNSFLVFETIIIPFYNGHLQLFQVLTNRGSKFVDLSASGLAKSVNDCLRLSFQWLERSMALVAEKLVGSYRGAQRARRRTPR
mmetsp:Transcript_4580/g.13840  ORF Transcript_4580/g.13840 Transcript_4580/m.13840 type:complete len:232 (-) Transcript_4580:871-1566(-)